MIRTTIDPHFTGTTRCTTRFPTRFSSGTRTAPERVGMTLLEILLAVTIFFGALTVLSQLTWNGSRAAIQSRLKTQAIVRCEAKLAEVLSGIEDRQSKTEVPFSDDSQWTYSVSLNEGPFPDLWQLEVLVSHTGGSRLANVTFSLKRWMRDPSLFVKAAEAQKILESLGTSRQNPEANR